MESKTLYKLALVIAATLVVLGALLAAFHFAYANRVGPRVSIGGVRVGGMTRAEVETLLENTLGRYFEEGLPFTYEDRRVFLDPVYQDDNNIELSHEILYADLDSLVDFAYSVDKGRGFFLNLKDKAFLLAFGKNIRPPFSLDRPALRRALEAEFMEFESPASDATLAYSADQRKFFLQKEQLGHVLDYGAAMDGFERDFLSLRYGGHDISLIPDLPQKKRSDLLPVLDEANALIGQLPVVFESGEDSWEANADEFGNWVVSRPKKKGVALDVDDAAAEEFFVKIREEVDVAPTEAKFEISGTKVAEFQASAPGREVDVKAALQALRGSLRKGELLPVELSFIETLPQVTNENVNDLGIRELLGTGHSNFAGSPSNRRHNIAVGSSSVNGTLVAPGEEFSLIAVLGEIEAETGYLPELVIKGNETIPEYGGGLCQVGTTSFRAAMESGLPITERRNHSYNVSYYLENGLPGTDATIYPPHPDLSFLNDTAHHVLLQTRIEGNDLYYEIWGTRDGRTSSRTAPEVWGRTAPPPTKLIETTDLEVGEKKCTERAHAGIKASFTYTIKYPDEEDPVEKVFNSNYRPWQEVCLIGVEELSEDSDEEAEEEILE